MTATKLHGPDAGLSFSEATGPEHGVAAEAELPPLGSGSSGGTAAAAAGQASCRKLHPLQATGSQECRAWAVAATSCSQLPSCPSFAGRLAAQGRSAGLPVARRAGAAGGARGAGQSGRCQATRGHLRRRL